MIKKLTLIVIILTFLFLIVYISPVIDYSILNPDWNGYSKLLITLKAKVVNKPLVIKVSNPESAVIITIPYKKYFKSEINFLKKFVREGGELIILDDFGCGNQLLNSLGRYLIIINNSMLIDPLYNFKNGKLPRIINFNTNFPEVRNISSIILNHASGLAIVNPRKVDVLAYSSAFSFLDTNLNNEYDLGEKKGPIPIIAKFKYGLGTVYVISDPSFLINSMIELHFTN